MYTSALEMHIEVLQGLQKVAAYTQDMFLPGEIDMHLNRQQNRIIEEIVNRKFQDTEVYSDYISPLIVKNKHLQAIIPQITDPDYEPFTVYAALPEQYLYLVADRSKVVTSSQYPLCLDLTQFKTKAPSAVSFTEYIAVVPMFVPTVTGAPYFYNTQVTMVKSGNPVVFSVPSGLNSIPSPNSSFYITDYLVQLGTINGCRVYWQYYKNTYAPGSFIFVTNDPTITSVTVSCSVSSSSTASGGSTGSIPFTASVFTTPNYTATTVPGYQDEIVPNQLTELDELGEQFANVFYSPLPENPKTVLHGKFIRGYENKSFLISEFVIDYVRQPKQISLSLNQVSELGGAGPQIVVDRTIEYLKLAIENPGYQAFLNDNRLRDQT